MRNFSRSRSRRVPTIIAMAIVASFLLTIPWRIVQAAAGDLDPTFGIGGRVTTDVFGDRDDAPTAVIQPDGKIIAVGSSFNPNGPGGLVLIRYNTDGSLDGSYGSAGKSVVPAGVLAHSAAIQQDGRVVVGGTSGIGFGLNRCNIDGSMDLGFGAGGTVITNFLGFGASANAVAIQPDGKIIAVGFAETSFSSQPRSDFAIARYNTDGSLDAGFGVGGKVTTDFVGLADIANAVAIQADGKIVVAGSALPVLTAFELKDFALARYNSDGSLDPSFGTGGKLRTDFHGQFDQALGVAALPNGKIIACGVATDNNLPSGSDFALVRYNSNGSLDPAFGSNGKVETDFLSEADWANAIAVQPDGKIVLAGFKGKGPHADFTDFAVARYNASGSLDASFGAGGKVTTDFFGFSNTARAVLIQQDGKIVAVGRAENQAILGDVALARYKGDSFDLCLQDESNGNLLQLNTTTGEYEFSNCGGFTLGGTGAITRRGSLTTLQQNGPDRRVLVKIDGAANKATASIQVLSTGATFSITDRNILNNTCVCGTTHQGITGPR